MAEDTSPGLASVIAGAIESRLVDVHTSLPGRVESYDVARQVADIKPMLRRVIRRADMTRVSEELPVIPCVPVLWQRGGGAFLSLPLTAGDFGLLVFADYTIDRFRSTGDDSDPGDERRFDLANATFFPCGPYPSSDTLADSSGSEVRIGLDGSYVAAISASEARFPTEAVEFLARADRVLTQLQNQATKYDAHTHLETGGTTDPPLAAARVGTVPSVASDTVKGT